MTVTKSFEDKIS